MELIKYTSYEDFKEALAGELKRTADGFVKIGYLLKEARDTEILSESEYKNVNEFAKEEFGLEASQVSRFIAINERFGEGDYLKLGYEGYGVKKLSMMLTLPEAITEELDPSYSASDIETIKQEYKEEQQISDVEVYLEGQEPGDLLTKVIKNLGRDDDGLFMILYGRLKVATTMKDVIVKETMAPMGSSAYNTRVTGVGKVLVTCNPQGLTITQMRSEEKETHSWEEVAASWVSILPKATTGVEAWELLYQEKYGKAEEETVAEPMVNRVVPSAEHKKKVEEKKVEKAKEIVKKAEPKEEPAPEPVEEPQKEEIAPVQMPENVEKLKCEETSEPEKVEAEVVEEPKTEDSATMRGWQADVTNKLHILQDCVKTKMWKKAHGTAVDMIWDLERLMNAGDDSEA